MLPNPLILKREAWQLNSALNTPPPTATTGTSLEAFALNKVALMTPISAQMPYTPRSPRPSECNALCADMAETVLTPKAIASTTAKQSCTASGTVSQSSDLLPPTTSGRSKRSLETDPVETDARPTKHRVTEEDLIHNPFPALRHHGVPISYVRDNIVRVSKKFFNIDDGAVVSIKSKPISRPGKVSVNVIPRRAGASPFRVNFNRPVQCPKDEVAPKCRSLDPESPLMADKSDSTEELEMPLHLEVATLRIPVLGQLLLSGHIFKGDLLEVELPHPEVLHDVMKWAYTGEMNENERSKIESCLALFAGPSVEHISQ